jgi:hypothetical protein
MRGFIIYLEASDFFWRIVIVVIIHGSVVGVLEVDMD